MQVSFADTYFGALLVHPLVTYHILRKEGGSVFFEMMQQVSFTFTYFSAFLVHPLVTSHTLRVDEAAGAEPRCSSTVD